MNFKRAFRKIVHDLYYLATGKPGMEYALRCRDVAGHIDCGDAPQKGNEALRFKLHLFLCQACRDYFDISERVSQTLRDSVRSKAREVDLLKLNQALTQKYEPLESSFKEKMDRRDPPSN